MFRVRLTWVVVGGLAALLVAAAIDALHSSGSSASSTTEAGAPTQDASARGAPIRTETTPETPPRCRAEQIAVSIDVLGGRPTIALRHARGKACRLARQPMKLTMWDRAGDRVRLARVDLGPEGQCPAEGQCLLGGVLSPGVERLIIIPRLGTCHRRGPFLAVVGVGAHVAQRTLSGNKVGCLRGG